MKAILRFDGGSRGNPGPSACAYQIESSEKNIIDGKKLGIGTNNYAEWMALVCGLKRFISEEDTKRIDLEIISDSELVVRQVLGIYKVRNQNISILHKKAMNLLSDFKSYEIKHKTREHNKVCDKKVNEILDSIA